MTDPSTLSDALYREFWQCFTDSLDAPYGFSSWFDEDRGQIDGDVPPDLFIRLAKVAEDWLVSS